MRCHSTIALLALLIACRPGPSERTARTHAATGAGDMTARIATTNRRLMAFYAAGQPDSVAALYLPDAHVMPPNQPAAVGTAAIRRWAAQGMDQGRWKLQLASTSISGDTTMAIEVGTYTVSFTPNAGATGTWAKAFSDAGKYLIVWTRRSGRWMIADDIYNSSLPPSGGPHE